MAPTKFTFKKVPNVGQYRAFALNQTEIKLDRKVVGCIAEMRGGTWRIRLAVKEEPNNFKWIALKKEFSDEAGARVALNRSFASIIEKFDLHKFED